MNEQTKRKQMTLIKMTQSKDTMTLYMNEQMKRIQMMLTTIFDVFLILKHFLKLKNLHQNDAKQRYNNIVPQ